MAAYQAPPSLGFSRQEHWSGLPFPSPKHEIEKWKWSRSVVSDSLRPHGLQPTRLLHPWDFPGKSTGVGCHCLLCQRALGISKLEIANWQLRFTKDWQILSYSMVGQRMLFLEFKKFLFYIGTYLINHVVLVSGVQQRDSVIHIYLFILSKILFSYRLSQNIG